MEQEGSLADSLVDSPEVQEGLVILKMCLISLVVDSEVLVVRAHQDFLASVKTLR